jgi:sulfoxide reductase heme-binding subunit YedZ
MDLTDASSVTGLFAMIVLTINVLLGMLIATAYKASQLWKKLPQRLKKINISRLHNQTAYLALVLVLLHPLLLTFDPGTKFKLVTILFPKDAPHQKTFVVLGTIAFYAVLIVIITSRKSVKKKISFRLWKNVHLISYATAMLFMVHGLMMDPELKDRPVDWRDGEKLLCLACALVLLTATVIRLRYQFTISKKFQQKRL